MKSKTRSVRTLRISKDRTKKIGARSIHDIIHNVKGFSFVEKVNYIRHHFTYYDGNYMIFNNENGQPNSKKYKLNKLIGDIINGKEDASALKEFNKQILEWRKEYDVKVYEKTEEEERKEAIDNFIRKIKTTIANNPYVDRIENFIKSPENNLETSIIRDLTYNQAKTLSSYWEKVKSRDYNALFKGIQKGFVRDVLTEEQLEQKRAERLMRQYALDLGYLRDETKAETN